MADELLPDAVEFNYRGPATVGERGRARLQNRDGAISEMLWAALTEAGWVDEMATRRLVVAVRVGVSPTESDVRVASRLGLLPGRHRRLTERGLIDEHGVSWGRQVGPLNGRAAGPGYRLLESERSPEDLEFAEDLLYTAAVQAGWLAGQPDEVVDVPDVQITVAVTRRSETDRHL